MPKPRIERIESMDDPRVEAYRNVRDRDLRRRHGVFMVESELVVRRLIEQSPVRTRSVLVNPTRLESMADVLRKLPDGVPVYAAEQDVFDGIAGFHIHRGVLAEAESPAPLSIDGLIAQAAPSGGTILVLEDLTNHDNVGGLFRCAAAFGVSGVALTERCADPLYRKATRVSIGCTLTVPFARCATAREATERLRGSGFTIVALSPGRSSVELDEFIASGADLSRIALLLGAEGPGLSSRAVAAADVAARIDIEPAIDSLNVVTAGAIALRAVRRAR